MARSTDDTTYVASPEAHPIDDLVTLGEADAVCGGCGSPGPCVVPATDIAPGKKVECSECDHTGRVKLNRWGRVTMLRGFKLVEDEEAGK